MDKQEETEQKLMRDLLATNKELADKLEQTEAVVEDQNSTIIKYENMYSKINELLDDKGKTNTLKLAQ